MSEIDAFLEEYKVDSALMKSLHEAFAETSKKDENKALSAAVSSPDEIMTFEFEEAKDVVTLCQEMDIELQRHQKLEELTEYLQKSAGSDNAKLSAQGTTLSFEKVNTLVAQAHELIDQRENLAHLQMELRASIVHFIQRREMNEKIDFYDQMKTYGQFCRNSDLFAEGLQKVTSGWLFFINRQNFKEYRQQMDIHNHLVQRIERSAIAVASDFLNTFAAKMQSKRPKAIELFGKGFKDVGDKGCKNELLALVNFDWLISKATDRQSGASSADSEALLTEFMSVFGEELHGWKSFKNLWSHQLNTQLFASAITKFQSLFIKTITQETTEIVELVFKEAEPMRIVEQSECFLWAVSASIVSFFGKDQNAEKLLLSELQSHLIKGIALLLKTKSQKQTDFESMILFYQQSQKIRENKQYLTPNGDFHGFLADWKNSLDVELGEEILAEHLTNFVETARRTLFSALFEVLDFQIEYMLTRVTNQVFSSQDLKSEIDFFDKYQPQTDASPNRSASTTKTPNFAISYSIKVLFYLVQSLKLISDTNNDFDRQPKRLAVLATKKVLSSAMGIKSQPKSFIYTVQNLLALFSLVKSKQTLDVLFEMSEDQLSVGAVFAADVNDPDKFADDNFPYFIAGLSNVIVNTEIRAFDELLLANKWNDETAAAQELRTKLTSRLKAYISEMTQSAAPETASFLRSVFFPNLAIRLNQLATALPVPAASQKDIQTLILHTFDALFALSS